ncbi:hypothetical protein WJX72_002309 [[Myrmecia] bisecta]|uniref:Uncharacterized protein n=1 Tax=[Myrmecia] bisecta TaxID=41462 RepID=A0AAW1PXA2_9CHLO
MAFFQRVLNHLFHEVLVNGLANNPTFQRFAIRSNKAISEVLERGAQKQSVLGEKAQEFHKTFRQEFSKGVDEQFGRNKPPQQRKQ